MLCFTQMQPVGLGSSLDGKVLHALVGPKAGDEQNLPAFSRPHVLGEGMGDRSQAGYIELHHRQRRIQRAVLERALPPMAGVYVLWFKSKPMARNGQAVPALLPEPVATWPG